MTPASALLDELYRTGHAEGPDGEPVAAFPSGMPRLHTDALRALIREHRCERTLEVGLGFGLSMLAIGEASPGPHVAIDPLQHENYHGIALRHAERAGLTSRLRFIAEPSHVALPRLHQEGLRLDFALIDGLHFFDTAMVDFYFADLMLDPGGVLVLHDTWMPAIAQLLEFVVRNRAYERLPGPDDRIAFLRKTAEDDRPWGTHALFRGGSVARVRRLYRRRVRRLKY